VEEVVVLDIVVEVYEVVMKGDEANGNLSIGVDGESVEIGVEIKELSIAGANKSLASAVAITETMDGGAAPHSAGNGKFGCCYAGKWGANRSGGK